MSQQLPFDETAREHFLRGVDAVANTMKRALGPSGRDVVRDNRYGPLPGAEKAPLATEAAELRAPYTHMGVSLIRDVARKTRGEVGDGTTTAVILTQAMISECFRAIGAGADVVSLKNGMEKAVACIVEELKGAAKSVTSREQLKAIASTAAHSHEIGENIGEVVDGLGRYSTVVVEEGRAKGIETEHVAGMEFNRGFASPDFVTDAEKMEAVIEEPGVLITERGFSTASDLMPMLDRVVATANGIVIISGDMGEEALAALVAHKHQGTLKCLVVKAPAFGDRRTAILEDIAILTGARILSEEKRRMPASIVPEDLGRARRVVASKDRTIVVGGKGSQEQIESRVRRLRSQIDGSAPGYERDRLEERIARLSGGVSIIRIGAMPGINAEEVRRRAETAVAAARAALEEGILPGGGIALIAASSALDALSLEGNEAAGASIVRRAVEEPLRQLAANAGEEGSVAADRVRGPRVGLGFEAVRREYGSMEDRGIVDPVKVIRIALQNAAVAATTTLMTASPVADTPERGSGARVNAADSAAMSDGRRRLSSCRTQKHRTA